MFLASEPCGSSDEAFGVFLGLLAAMWTVRDFDDDQSDIDLMRPKLRAVSSRSVGDGGKMSNGQAGGTVVKRERGDSEETRTRRQSSNVVWERRDFPPTCVRGRIFP